MEVDRRRIRPEVLAALSQVPEVQKQVRHVANAIRRDAGRLAPKRSKKGTLRRNIEVERVYDPVTRRVSYLVGWGQKAWYGWLVEAGTEDALPRPHLVPAAIAHGAVAMRGDQR
ncbi:HK97 gp10 family phage protein [Micromonospora sp. NPDC051300]|uniref:HK97 gp10 family phage protein n=1 Tax=Micromonospora sp. NPDC051300 TaxID=3364286 RepID=UPI0037A1D780